MATAKEIVFKAMSYDGRKEDEKGNIIFNTDYYGGKVNRHIPWCCAFVWDIFRMCDASKLFFGGKKTAYVPAVETYAVKTKKTVKKTEGQCGDIALFDFAKNGISQHIGFIIYQKENGDYVTIEGNTSDSSQSDGGTVAVKTRKQSQIRCIYRPCYEKKIEKEPKYKIGESYHTIRPRSLRTKPKTDATKLGTLGAGKKIKCLEVEKVGKNLWIKTDKGWISGYYNGKKYVG